MGADPFNLRTDLTDLTKRAPDLATRLDQVRTLLDVPLPVTTTEAMSSNVGDPVEQLRAAQNRAVEDRMRLAREFDDLLIQVRALDEIEHFLAPTPFTQLRTAVSAARW